MFVCSLIKEATRQRRLYSTQIPRQATVATYTQHGDPLQTVRLETHDLPSLQPNQALIQMIHAPINPADLNMIVGNYGVSSSLPAVGGNEGVGHVLEVGPGVQKLKVGDLVLPGRTGLGTWRTHGVFNENDLLSVPFAQGIKTEYLATLSVNPATALRMLTDFVRLEEGDTVIQNGANGMVGLSVVQIAAARGIKTINIIRRRSDYENLVERMKEYGAYIVCGDDYVRSQEFRKLIADLPKPKLALNCVGGESATEMVRLLGPGGVMVTYGGMSYKPVTVPTSSFIFNDVQLRGFWMSRWYEQQGEQGRAALLQELVELVRTNKLRLWMEKHPLNNLQTALHRAKNSSERDRKVLLTME